MTKILIVEDERAIADLIEGLLEDEGYTVTTAVNGREGLARVAEERPDVVLTDVMMPIMDGITMCGMLQAEPAFQAIPIILMTVGRDLDTTQCHYAVLVRKPFGLDVLLDTIAQVVEQGRASVE